MLARRWTRPLVEVLAQRSTYPAFPPTRAYAIRSFSLSTNLKYIKKPRDEGIKIPLVQLVDNENNLCPPEPVADILKRIKRRTHFIELVQEDPPLVKIKDRVTEKAARAAAKAKKRVKKMERKEIQMTWNVSDSDLGHKVMKAREQLEDNNLVDIAFAPKAKQRLPPVEAMKGRMQTVIDALQDIAIERQERTLERGVGIIFLRLDKSKTEQNE